MQLGLIAGRLAGWQMKCGQIFKIQVFKLFAAFNKVTALLEQYECIYMVFSAKACFKVAVRSVKIGKAIVFLVDLYY